jgi:hypothetical protein
VNDEFWTDTYVEDLDPSEKLIFLYLITNPLCNIAGIYEIKIKRIAYETGFDKEMVEKILGRFEKDQKIIRKNDWIIICNFVKNQANNPSVLQGVQRILDRLPSDCIQAVHSLSYFTLLNLTLPNYKTLSKDNDGKASDDDGVPPSDQEVVMVPLEESPPKRKRPALSPYGNNDINLLFEKFETLGMPIAAKIKLNRYAGGRLVKKHGVEKTLHAIEYAISLLGKPYEPQVTDLIDLENKLPKLALSFRRKEDHDSSYFVTI